MVLPVQALNATDALTAVEPPGGPALFKHILTRPVTPWSKNRSPQRRTVQMVLNGAGIRDTARILGVNRNTVSAQFKKNGAARALVKSFMLTPYTSIED
ncbi:hypothetical protein CWM47_04345 [Spirosoma pollinicola]|uniref:Insertion element IS1 protein InsA helix-turn-helix domain-containing protein n=1 Tax=Spirosoma pollinicola TaxID=2057025 RepID=A0A2K8YU89_9BACT|nr:IS1-like element transposase [Spirosoma pollinicola]AUD01118.1 hypothetical protein CWM47_04345 [Spirosoma pollinicola]